MRRVLGERPGDGEDRVGFDLAVRQRGKIPIEVVDEAVGWHDPAAERTRHADLAGEKNALTLGDLAFAAGQRALLVETPGAEAVEGGVR